MSGGHFGSIPSEIGVAARQIDRLVERYSGHEDVDCSFSDLTLARFEECAVILRIASAILQRVDLLVCADDSEETFNELWTRDLSLLREESNSRLLGLLEAETALRAKYQGLALDVVDEIRAAEKKYARLLDAIEKATERPSGNACK